MTEQTERPVLTLVDVVRSRLSYCPATGAITWKRNVGTRGRAGRDATCLTGAGYRTVKINGRRYQAHRIAWMLAYGSHPPQYIDHINGDRGDNRLSNLRQATRSQNAQNARIRDDNKCGLKGVCWHASARKYHAQIQAHGTRLSLGFFESKEDAHEAYVAAARTLHGHYARV